MRRLTPALVLLAAAASLSAQERRQGVPGGSAQQPRTFTGVISDDGCPLGTHGHMQMGPTDAECVKQCVLLHRSLYVLADGKVHYHLSDQKTPENFAGEKVRVVGTLDEKGTTITVESIAAAK